MNAGRPVRLYRDGGEQAVRIPAELELPGEGAVMRREGDRLVIEPTTPGIVFNDVEANVARNQALLEWLAMLEPLGPEDRMPSIDDLLPEPFDL